MSLAITLALATHSGLVIVYYVLIVYYVKWPCNNNAHCNNNAQCNNKAIVVLHCAQTVVFTMLNGMATFFLTPTVHM